MAKEEQKTTPKKVLAPKKAANATGTPKKPRARGKYYIDRKELLAEVIVSKENDRMSDKLAAMLTLLTEKYAKSAQFARYTFNEDMQAYAKMMLVRTWNSFKPEKSDNPFAYYTQCIKSSFIQFLNQEKRQRNIRDALLVDNGMSPSYTYQMEYQEKQDEMRRQAHDEEDHDVVLEEMRELNGVEDSDAFGDNS